jgi:uncharacterized cupredoxin-like copper-binding protein
MLGACVLCAVLAWAALGGAALGAGDLAAQEPRTVRLTLGDARNRMVFAPKTLSFETGVLYKLVLHNAGPEKHELDAPELVSAVYTRKVEVLDADGRMLAEVKTPTLQEIEVAPGATVEWYFVPVRTVEDGELLCDLPGHREAGMVGRFSIR